MYNWRTKINENDPDDPAIIDGFVNWYISHRDEVSSWEDVTLEICKDKKVLDVGAVCHNKRNVVMSTWKHRKIKEAAREILGVDIMEEMIEWLNRRGEKFVYADATSDIDLGGRYDVVVMGDLIEHVNNVEGLLEFGKRHLDKDGVMIITTPNPVYHELLNREIYDGVPIANMEHTCWITPTNMNELCFRCDLNLIKIFEIIPKNYRCNKGMFKKIPHVFKVQSYMYLCKNRNYLENI